MNPGPSVEIAVGCDRLFEPLREFLSLMAKPRSTARGSIADRLKLRFLQRTPTHNEVKAQTIASEVFRKIHSLYLNQTFTIYLLKNLPQGPVEWNFDISVISLPWPIR